MTSKKIFSLARVLTLKWGHDKKTMLPPPGDTYEMDEATLFPPSMEEDLEWSPETVRDEAPLFPEDLQEEIETLFPPTDRDPPVIAAAKRFLSKYSGELAPDTERMSGSQDDSGDLLERDLASKPDKFTDQHGEYVTIGDAKAYLSEDGGVTFRVGGRAISADLVAKDLGVDLEALKALVVQLHAHGNSFEMEPSPPTDPMPSVASTANRIADRYMKRGK